MWLVNRQSARSLISYLYRSYRSLEWQAHLVVAIAILAMAYVQIVRPFYWPGGDALNYLQTARFLLRKPEGLYVPWRPPGMGVFLILSGVAWLDTFKIFIALYAAMSVAIPVLIYAVIRRFNANWALVAGLIAIFGAIPYAYSKVAAPEELFHFIHFGVLALVAAYLFRPDNKMLPYAICFGLFALNLVRPVAALYYWIFFLCALMLVRRYLKHVLLATVVYVLLMGTWALGDRAYGASIFPTLYGPGSLPQRWFAEVYFSGDQYQFVSELPPVPMIKPKDGPASAQMYDSVRWYIQKYPKTWQVPTSERPNLLFGRFADNPDGLVSAVVGKPNFAYFNFLRTALQMRHGPWGAERLMQQVAAEHGNSGARGILNYFIHNPSKLLVGGTPSFSGRNLLGIFYFARVREAMNRIYSLAWGLADMDPNWLEDYQVNPTPDALDRIYNGVTLRGLDLLGPKNGPASEEFFSAIHFFIRAYPVYWENANGWLSRYKGNPDGLFRALFNSDNPYDRLIYEGFYWESLIKYYGVGPADRLFSRVALETMKAYPFSTVIFGDNVLHITLIRTIADIKSRFHGVEKFWPGGNIYDFGGIIYKVERNDLTGLTPGLKGELRPVIYSDAFVDAIGVAYATMHLVAPLFFIASLVLLPCSLLGPAWRLVVFLAAAYAYNVAVIAIFGNFSDPRYEDVFILLPVMLACLGSHSAISTFKQRSKLRFDGEVPPPLQHR